MVSLAGETLAFCKGPAVADELVGPVRDLLPGDMVEVVDGFVGKFVVGS